MHEVSARGSPSKLAIVPAGDRSDERPGGSAGRARPAAPRQPADPRQPVAPRQPATPRAEGPARRAAGGTGAGPARPARPPGGAEGPPSGGSPGRSGGRVIRPAASRPRSAEADFDLDQVDDEGLPRWLSQAIATPFDTATDAGPVSASAPARPRPLPTPGTDERTARPGEPTLRPAERAGADDRRQADERDEPTQGGDVFARTTSHDGDRFDPRTAVIDTDLVDLFAEPSTAVRTGASTAKASPVAPGASPTSPTTVVAGPLVAPPLVASPLAAEPFPAAVAAEGDIAGAAVDPSTSTVNRTKIAGRSRRPRVRKVRRVVRSVDAWSVFKVSLVFYALAYVVVLVAGVLLWNLAISTGTVANLEGLVKELFGLDKFTIDGAQLYRASWALGAFLAIGGTGLNVVAAVLFNLITDLVGGVRLTVLEEEVRADVPRRRRFRRAPKGEGRADSVDVPRPASGNVSPP